MDVNQLHEVFAAGASLAQKLEDFRSARLHHIWKELCIDRPVALFVPHLLPFESVRPGNYKYRDRDDNEIRISNNLHSRLGESLQELSPKNSSRRVRPEDYYRGDKPTFDVISRSGCHQDKCY